MAITFHIPGALREFTGGRTSIEVAILKGTLSDALAALWAIHPGVRDRVLNEQGQLRQHINIFVGNENSRYTGGLATAISDGCQISIVPAVSGGVYSEEKHFSAFSAEFLSALGGDAKSQRRSRL